MVTSGDSIEIEKSHEDLIIEHGNGAEDDQNDKIEKLKAEHRIQNDIDNDNNTPIEDSNGVTTNGEQNHTDNGEQNQEASKEEICDETKSDEALAQSDDSTTDAVKNDDGTEETINGKSMSTDDVTASDSQESEKKSKEAEVEESVATEVAEIEQPRSEKVEETQASEKEELDEKGVESETQELNAEAQQVEAEEMKSEASESVPTTSDRSEKAENEKASSSGPSNEEPAKVDEAEVLTIEDDDDDDITILDEEEEKHDAAKASKQDVVENGNAEQMEVDDASNATTSKENGNAVEMEDSSAINGKGTKRDVECIELDDDDEVEEVQSPAAKKVKLDDVEAKESEEGKENLEKKKEEEKKPEAELTSSAKLLEKLTEYIDNAIDTNNTVHRKILDALLGGINIQVQREPLSVRKLILEKQLVLPNTISFPPSLVVDMLIEHDPDFPVGKVITKMFGDDRPKMSEAEKKEKAVLKASVPAPAMTKFLMDIGQDMVQESTYNDIVHAKNLPEVPKNYDTYKQVAQQLKPVWETLKKRNEPYKLKLKECSICDFQTESTLALNTHKAIIHQRGSKFQCAFCKEYETSEAKMIEHCFNAHLVVAKPEEKESKYPCAICDEDFNFKGVREQHWKNCKKDYIRVKQTMVPKQPDDILHLNRWLWEKPPVDPTILQQQQAAQAQQLKKQQQQQQLNAARQLENMKKQQQQAQQAALLHQQQLAAQQQQKAQQAQMRQLTQMMQRGSPLNSNMFAALQQQIQRQNRSLGNNGSPLTNAMTAAALQKQLAAAAKNHGGPAAIQAAIASMKTNQKTPISKNVKLQPTLKTPSISSPIAIAANSQQCEICDQTVADKDKYLMHLQGLHKQMQGKTMNEMSQGAPLACSRCRDRFWTYEGLERHLVMSHGLVTADLLQKAQKKEDGGRCKLCGKQYAFNMLQHLVADHQVKLCSAEIMYSCDVCAFKCTSYQTLETHLTTNHPKGSTTGKKKTDCITLDD